MVQSPSPLPIPASIVASQYSLADGFICDLRGLFWAAILLASVSAASLLGGVGAWALGFVGVCAFVRNFHAAHEGFHADHRRNPIRWMRVLCLLPTSLIALGYDALWSNHKRHHASPGGETDPDHFLVTGPWYRGLIAAFLQPEWAALRWIQRHGITRSVGVTWLWNALFYGLIAVVLGPWGLLIWTIVTRIGNTASWFIFDWILHHPAAYGTFDRLPVPGVLRPLWSVLYSRGNLLAVEHHTVHHRYAFVKSHDLPALAAELRAARER